MKITIIIVVDEMMTAMIRIIEDNDNNCGGRDGNIHHDHRFRCKRFFP